jgi:DNA replication protein DnaC
MLNEKINELCDLLKLPGIYQSYSYISDKASNEDLSYSEYLYEILQSEYQLRDKRSKETLLKFASFPKVKTIDTFDFSCANVDKNLINEILTMRFIDETKNILLLGPSGVGKTHLALSIGYAATQNRIKTKFISASDLILQLKSAKLQNKLDYYLKRIIMPSKLLIIDELGYFKLDEIESNLFFQIVNKKYETSSIIITTNLNFIKLKEVFNDNEALTTAILDRLIHHSYIINIQGESYRLREKKRPYTIPCQLRKLYHNFKTSSSLPETIHNSVSAEEIIS